MVTPLPPSLGGRQEELLCFGRPARLASSFVHAASPLSAASRVRSSAISQDRDASYGSGKDDRISVVSSSLLALDELFLGRTRFSEEISSGRGALYLI